MLPDDNNDADKQLIVSLGLPHDLPLVALSVLLAVLGGYVGLGLAGQAREAEGMRRRALLAGAAWALGLGIWTMHFVGILAARFPTDVAFSVLLTLMSFLLCVLVVGVSAFLVSRPEVSDMTRAVAAIFMGAGIVSMHYVGMHAIHGPFGMVHEPFHAVAATVLAVGASYAALRLLDIGMRGQALAVSAIAFGLAVSGMHYTAMMGMSIDPSIPGHGDGGLSVSSDMLTIAVAVLAFFISGFFLLYLVPEAAPHGAGAEAETTASVSVEPALTVGAIASGPPTTVMVPVETEGETRLVPSDSVCAIQATTHYTLVYDGEREYFSPWSISEAEMRLPSQDFMRVHRSHIVAVDKVKAVRRSGDGAAVEVGRPVPRVVPVSRSHYAELKAQLGLRQKLRDHAAAR